MLETFNLIAFAYLVKYCDNFSGLGLVLGNALHICTNSESMNKSDYCESTLFIFFPLYLDIRMNFILSALIFLRS